MIASANTSFHFPAEPQPLPNARVQVDVPFHRLALLNDRYRWWRPVLELLIAALMTLVLSVILFIMEAILTGGASLDGLEEDLTDPKQLVFALASVAIMIPACWLGARFGSRRPWGFLWSVMGGVRWGLFRAALGPVALIYVGYLLITIGFSLFDEGKEALELQPQALGMLLVAIAWVPAQTFAEELVFRGLIPQFFGAYIRTPWIGYGIGTIAFTAGHAYDWAGLLDIFAFAVCTAVMAHKTGGLELGMALHAVNNLMSFGLGVFVINDVNATDIPLTGVLTDIVVTVAITVLLLRSKRIQEHLRPPEGSTTARVLVPAGHGLVR